MKYDPSCLQSFPCDLRFKGFLRARARVGGSPPPRRIARRRSAWWSDDWNNHFHSIRHINEGLRAFADAHRWATYVELSGASSPFLRRTVGPSAQVEYIDTDLMYDLLHLSPKGYEVRRSIALHTVT